MSTDQEQGEDERIRAIVQEELEKQDSLTSGTVPVSRRGLLKGGAALGIGGLAGSVLSDGDSGRVSAQTAVGQVGTDSDRVDVYGNLVDATSANIDALNIGTTSALISVAASGQETLSSGSATVDTGLSATDATFYLALGINDPNADAKIAGRLFWHDSAGTYKVEIVEDGTSIGDPTVNYDILRVR